MKHFFKLFFLVCLMLSISNCASFKRFESTGTNVDLDGDNKIDAQYLDDHASNHEVGGSDSVFPADPNADRCLKWNDTSGETEWVDCNSVGVTDHGSLTGNDDNDHGEIYYTEAEIDALLASLQTDDISPSTTQTVTIVDSGDGSPAVDTLTPTVDVSISRLDVTCSDTDGCTPTMSETSMVDGQIIVIVNVSANDLNFIDDPGILEMIGDHTMVLGQYEQIALQYVTDRWIMINASEVTDFLSSSGTVLANISGTVQGITIDDDLSSTSGSDDTVPSAKATKDYVDSFVGCFDGTSRSSAPSSPIDGCVYVSQNGAGADWPGETVQGTTDYFVQYNGANYLPWPLDSPRLVTLAHAVQDAEPSYVVGTCAWADADGSWDPDTEVTGTDPYLVCRNASSWVTIRKQDGTLLVSKLQTASNVITDADGRVLIASEMNSVADATGTGDWDIPADQCDTASGKWFKIRSTGAHVNSLTSNDAADQFVLADGTVLTAGNELDTGGAIYNFCFVSCEAANKWFVSGEFGTCADGGLPD